MPHNIRLFTSFLAVAASFAATPATAGGVLTVAMTAGDIAVTTGTPDQGFEGFRFVGWSLYDGLVNWDLSKADAASDIKPGLATSWSRGLLEVGRQIAVARMGEHALDLMWQHTAEGQIPR